MRRRNVPHEIDSAFKAALDAELLHELDCRKCSTGHMAQCPTGMQLFRDTQIAQEKAGLVKPVL